MEKSEAATETEDRHLCSSEDGNSEVDGVTKQEEDLGDRKVAARPPSKSGDTPRGHALSSAQSSTETGGEHHRTRSIAGRELQLTSSRSDPSRTNLEPSLQLDEVWRRDLDSIDLPAYVKKKSTTLSFPEKLMLMLIHMENLFIRAGKSLADAPIAWTLEGRAVLIRDKVQLVKQWIPLFFPPGQFKSFTRKLYRWQFRQVNLPSREGPQSKDKHLVFANSFFQRDQRELMVYMRSITAAGVRRQKEREETESDKGTPTSSQTSLHSTAIDVARHTRTGLELPAIDQPTASFDLTRLQFYPGLASQYTSLPIQNPPFGLGVRQIQNPPFGLGVQQIQQAYAALMQLDPRVQQNLILASFMNNPQASQASIPAFLTSSDYPLALAGRQAVPVRQQVARGDEEQKQPGGSNADEQERIRRAAAILLRGINLPSRPPNRPSGRGGDQRDQGPS